MGSTLRNHRQKNIFRTTFVGLLLLFFVELLGGCTASEDPQSEELVKTGIPTFLGRTTASFTTPSAAYVLNGECDPISKGLEWSYDQIIWKTVPGECVNGTFSVNVVIPRIKSVYVRALTKMGQTEPGIAKIRFVLPPTAPAYEVVTAGSSVDPGDQGVQFTMSGFSDGTPGVSATRKLDSQVTGVVYGH